MPSASVKRVVTAVIALVAVSTMGLGAVVQAQESGAPDETSASTSTTASSTPAPEQQDYDPDTQPQIVGGVSTSTVTYPWMAACS